MIRAQFFPRNGKRFAAVEFGLSELALPFKDRSEIDMSPHLVVFSRRDSFQYVQSSSIVDYGFIKLVLPCQRPGQATVVHAYGWMVFAMVFPMYGQSFANDGFALGRLSFVLQHIVEGSERPGDFVAVVAEAVPAYRQTRAASGFGLRKFALIPSFQIVLVA